MASSNLNDKKPELADDKEKKVTIGNYISLIMACVFFSGVCATNQWWGIFDFTTINGSFGKVVTAVSQNADGKPAVPVSIGACLGILFLGKILAANIMRVIQMGGKINLKKSA